MVGRGTLLVILGFSLIFGLASNYWNRTSNEAVDNFTNYYNQTSAHNLAASGANVALTNIFMNPTNNASRSLSGNLSDGSYSVRIDSIGKLTLRVTSTGEYQDTTSTVQVTLGPKYFSVYGVYTATMAGVYWAPGDTVRGDFHSEDYFNIIGNPVFYGSVTSKYGMYTPPGYTRNPQIYGSYQSGVSVPMPNTSISNLQTAAAAGGFTFNNPSGGGSYDVYLTFNADGTVTYHTSVVTSDTTVALSTLAPNGVIYVNNGSIHVHGTVAGQVDMGAGGSSGNEGNIYINGSLMCNTDPQNNPASTDVIGIVAQNNVTVESDNAYKGVNPPNPPVNPYIEAAIYAQNGTFSSYYQSNSYYTGLGAVHVYGSISNHQIGVTSDPSITHGYNANYSWDSRFQNLQPPSFPITGSFKVVSWYE
ncbi:MAG TPA: hypothetical protein VIS48_12240 [Candidatus Kryptonia bacterium]